MIKRAAFLLFLLTSIVKADTTTNRLGLTIPTVGSPTWGQKVNQNFQILDATTAVVGNDVLLFPNGVQIGQPSVSTMTVGEGFFTNNHVFGMESVTTLAAGLVQTNSLESAGNFYPTTIATVGNCVGATSTGQLGFVQCISSLSVVGAASIAVYSNSVQVTSPTAIISFDSTTFSTTLVGGATAFVTSGPGMARLNYSNNGNLNLGAAGFTQTLSFGPITQPYAYVGTLEPNFYVVSNTSDVVLQPETGHVDIQIPSTTVGLTGQLNLYSRGPGGVDTVPYVGLRSSDTLTTSTVWTLPNIDGTSGQAIVTDGHANLSFQTASGSGGGVSVYPATATASFPFGANFSSITVSGTNPGTMYIKGSGVNNFGYSGSSMSVSGTASVMVTETTDQRIDAIEAPAFYVNITTSISNDIGAQTDVIYAKLHNTAPNNDPTVDGVAVHARAVDSLGSNGQLIGVMGEVFGQGTAPAYTGLWGTAGWASDLIGGTTSEFEGLRLIAQMTNLAGNVPVATGTLKMLYIPDFTNGHGAPNQSWPLFIAAPYPSFFNGFIGIGQRLPDAPLTIAVSTNTQWGIAVGSAPVGNTVDISTTNYTFTVTNTGVVTDLGQNTTGRFALTYGRTPDFLPDAVNITYTANNGVSDRMTGIRSTAFQTAANAGVLSVAVGVQAIASDTPTVNGNGTLEGVDARVTGAGNAPQYAGEVAHGNWDSALVGGTTSTIVGLQITNSITSGDGATGISTGTLKQLLISDPNGGGATANSWALYSTSRFPSYYNNFIGIGDKTPVASLSIAASTNTPFAVTVGSVAFFNGILPTANYTFTVSNQGQVSDFGETVTGPLSVYNISVGSQTYDAKFSSTTTNFHVAISTSGHLITSGPIPTISVCGTTPNGSVVGDDNNGTITVGGGSVTACTLTFASTWGSSPTCQEADSSVTPTADISAISATAVTFGFSASIGGGTIWYHCGCSGASCR